MLALRPCTERMAIEPMNGDNTSSFLSALTKELFVYHGAYSSFVSYFALLSFLPGHSSIKPFVSSSNLGISALDPSLDRSLTAIECSSPPLRLNLSKIRGMYIALRGHDHADAGSFPPLLIKKSLACLSLAQSAYKNSNLPSLPWMVEMATDAITERVALGG